MPLPPLVPLIIFLSAFSYNSSRYMGSSKNSSNNPCSTRKSTKEYYNSIQRSIDSFPCFAFLILPGACSPVDPGKNLQVRRCTRACTEAMPSGQCAPLHSCSHHCPAPPSNKQDAAITVDASVPVCNLWYSSMLTMNTSIASMSRPP